MQTANTSVVLKLHQLQLSKYLRSYTNTASSLIKLWATRIIRILQSLRKITSPGIKPLSVFVFFSFRWPWKDQCWPSERVLVIALDDTAEEDPTPAERLPNLFGAKNDTFNIHDWSRILSRNSSTLGKLFLLFLAAAASRPKGTLPPHPFSDLYSPP